MHFATIDREADPCGKPHGRWAILAYRLAIGTLIVSSMLYLFMPGTAYAQSYSGPGRPPIGDHPAATLVPKASLTESGAAEIIHVVEVGDNLTNVAERYGVKPADLAAYNQVMDYNHVLIGQKLRIPPVGMAVDETTVIEVNVTESAVTESTDTAPAAESTMTDSSVTDSSVTDSSVIESSAADSNVAEPVSSEPANTEADAVESLPGAGGYHVVRKGESLSAIARLYDVSLEELMALNDITNVNIVQMGKMLRLTDAVEPATAAPTPELKEILYAAKEGDTLSEIAKAHSVTVEQLMTDNDLTTETVRPGQELRILPPTDSLEAFGISAPVDGERKIVIDLSDQTLTAYQGDVVVMHTIVSTGKASTPTLPGEFVTYLKYKSQHMTGDDYDLPGVPWVMYYHEGYAIHGAYWHANFGTPTSHGCTNMTIPEAKALYSWAPLGTRVIVQE